MKPAPPVMSTRLLLCVVIADNLRARLLVGQRVISPSSFDCSRCALGSLCECVSVTLVNASDAVVFKDVTLMFRVACRACAAFVDLAGELAQRIVLLHLVDAFRKAQS